MWGHSVRPALARALLAVGSWAGHITTQSLGFLLRPLLAGPVGSQLKAWPMALPLGGRVGPQAGGHPGPGKVRGTFRTAEGQPRRPTSGSVESLQVTENVHTKRPTWPRAPAPQLCWVAQWSAVTVGKHTAPLNQPTNLSTAVLLHRLTKPPSIQTVAPGPLHLYIDRKTCTSSVSNSTAYQEAGRTCGAPRC